jgi:myosin heavy subunit
MLREKNEKISMLTAEFDAHRADFRSTLDSLEMASTETERVYEEQKRDLLAQLEALNELKEQREDFEGVARQLKQLEDLVAELEEGLEESRRGEAEARGEVEFLRGEVERGRSELKRERDKAAASASGNGISARELELKDDEIRGLKAIIHRLSDGAGSAVSSAVNGVVGRGEGEEAEKLRAAFEESQREKEALERELEQLRRDAATTNGHARHESERTATASPDKPAALGRKRSDTVKASSQSRNAPPSAPLPSRPTNGNTVSSPLFCEMCYSGSHDTLDCSQLQSPKKPTRPTQPEPEPEPEPEPYSPGKENEHAGAITSGKGSVEEEKWCALCEKDGHLAFDCPEEQY